MCQKFVFENLLLSILFFLSKAYLCRKFCKKFLFFPRTLLASLRVTNGLISNSVPLTFNASHDGRGNVGFEVRVVGIKSIKSAFPPLF